MGSILVVDDERDIRVILTEILQAEGYSVSQADCAEKAIQMIKNNTPDVVLLDKVIPGRMSGLDAISHIKKIDQNIKVIMLTGYGNVKAAVKAIKMGAYDYLMKPTDVEDLRSKLEGAKKRREKQKRRINAALSTEFNSYV